MMAMRAFGLLSAIGTVVIVAVAMKAATACSCNRLSVEEAYSQAEIVFEGKVIDIDGPRTYGQWPAGRVTFAVLKVWKGHVPPGLKMPAVPSGSGCLGFYSNHLKKGSELLVYASLDSWTPTGEKAYFTNACARTSLLKDAKQDLSTLSKIVNRTLPKNPQPKKTPPALFR
jgi:hypothetical protein